MKKTCVAFLSLLLVFVLISCHQDENGGKEESIPKKFELVKNLELANLGIGFVDYIDIKENIANIVLTQSSRVYTIHITDEISKKCIDYLNNALENAEPLNIEIVKNSREIGRVCQLDENENEKFRKTLIPIPRDSITTSKSSRNYVFDASDYFYHMVIYDQELELVNYDYIGDGCFARAHFWCHVLEERLGAGDKIGKIFLYGNPLRAQGTSLNCYAEWGWHVVPGILKDGILWALDPIMFEDAVDLWEWITKCTNGGSYSYYYFEEDWHVYKRGRNGAICYDDSLADTYKILNLIKNDVGCDEPKFLKCETCY